MTDAELIEKVRGMYGYLHAHGMTNYIDTIAALVERIEAGGGLTVGVSERSEFRVIEIRVVNPGRDGFFEPSIWANRLDYALMKGGRPALDDLLMQIEWLRGRVQQAYANRSADHAEADR